MKQSDNQTEVRFKFGENWLRFLKGLRPEDVREAEESLQEKLGDIEGKTFMDIGCGSGLFSLAARNLGAKVVSFDYDEQSVECARFLKSEHHPDSESWTIHKGSALDREFLTGLGKADIVYSWGVLHHTGDMWKAMKNAVSCVKGGGRLFISIYNDQGGWSRVWKKLKYLYNTGPKWLQGPMTLGCILWFEGRSLLIQLLCLRNPIKYFLQRKQGRGMGVWHDARDWMGGYPFEVAKPEEIFEFCHSQGHSLEFLKTNAGGIACNEYVFLHGGADTCVE